MSGMHVTIKTDTFITKLQIGLEITLFCKLVHFDAIVQTNGPSLFHRVGQVLLDQSKFKIISIL